MYGSLFYSWKVCCLPFCLGYNYFRNWDMIFTWRGSNPLCFLEEANLYYYAKALINLNSNEVSKPRWFFISPKNKLVLTNHVCFLQYCCVATPAFPFQRQFSNSHWNFWLIFLISYFRSVYILQYNILRNWKYIFPNFGKALAKSQWLKTYLVKSLADLQDLILQNVLFYKLFC